MLLLLLETGFSARSVPRGYKKDYRRKNSSVGKSRRGGQLETQFREDLIPEAEE
jgi:hypothetical protein